MARAPRLTPTRLREDRLLAQSAQLLLGVLASHYPQDMDLRSAVRDLTAFVGGLDALKVEPEEKDPTWPPSADDHGQRRAELKR